MRILSITRISGKSEKFCAAFDDGAEIRVSAAQIADYNLYSGRELSDSEYDDLSCALQLSSSKAHAIRILGSRNLSSAEISKRLVSRGIDAAVAGETVEWLEDVGAVDDAGYASLIVNHYISKGYGLARIRDELFRRGIPRDLWDDALASADGFNEAALGFLEKKLHGTSEKDELRKAAEALRRRGFSYSEASEAISNYLENLESEQRLSDR